VTVPSITTAATSTSTRARAGATSRRLASARGLALALAVALAGCGSSATPTSSPSTSTPSPTASAKLTVVAAGLANPRQLTVAADGTVYVAEAGNGGTSECTKSTGGQPICIGLSGSIARIENGRAVDVVSHLPSVASPGGQDASGPAAVSATGSQLAFVVQDTDIDSAGANQFKADGQALGHVVLAGTDGTGVRLSADLARYEAIHDPDHGAGATAKTAIESDPYGLVAYRGGYAVADAAGNDLLWVDPAGVVHLLAVFPTQTETTAATSTSATPAKSTSPKAGAAAPRVVVQSVPTSVAVGPDGALYVGELTGAPFKVASARVWRVVPGSAPTVYASGFTNISAIAFDRSGRLLVLEIDRRGLTDPSASGELIRVAAGGRRTVLASAGLSSPTGLGVGPDGSIYIADNGSSPSTGNGSHGELLKLTTTT
jgi:glucose/arabinose dehydrogenase